MSIAQPTMLETVRGTLAAYAPGRAVLRAANAAKGVIAAGDWTTGVDRYIRKNPDFEYPTSSWGIASVCAGADRYRFSEEITSAPSRARTETVTQATIAASEASVPVGKKQKHITNYFRFKSKTPAAPAEEEPIHLNADISKPPINLPPNVSYVKMGNFMTSSTVNRTGRRHGPNGRFTEGPIEKPVKPTQPRNARGRFASAVKSFFTRNNTKGGKHSRMRTRKHKRRH